MKAKLGPFPFLRRRLLSLNRRWNYILFFSFVLECVSGSVHDFLLIISSFSSHSFSQLAGHIQHRITLAPTLKHHCYYSLIVVWHLVNACWQKCLFIWCWFDFCHVVNVKILNISIHLEPAHRSLTGRIFMVIAVIPDILFSLYFIYYYTRKTLKSFCCCWILCKCAALWIHGKHFPSAQNRSRYTYMYE